MLTVVTASGVAQFIYCCIYALLLSVLNAWIGVQRVLVFCGFGRNVQICCRVQSSGNVIMPDFWPYCIPVPMALQKAVPMIELTITKY
jgi:hypothetical protein